MTNPIEPLRGQRADHAQLHDRCSRNKEAANWNENCFLRRAERDDPVVDLGEHRQIMVCVCIGPNDRNMCPGLAYRCRRKCRRYFSQGGSILYGAGG